MSKETYPQINPCMIWSHISENVISDPKVIAHILRNFEDQALDEARERWPGHDIAVKLRWHIVALQDQWDSDQKIHVLTSMFDVTIL
jgi:hypothetical protein